MAFTSFAANAAWMEMVRCAGDLLVWCQQLLLHGDLAVAEPRTLRYRLLPVAGRLAHRARRSDWPWTSDLLASPPDPRTHISNKANTATSGDLS